MELLSPLCPSFPQLNTQIKGKPDILSSRGFLVTEIQSKHRMGISESPKVKSLSLAQGILCGVGNIPHPGVAREEPKKNRPTAALVLDRGG